MHYFKKLSLLVFSLIFSTSLFAQIPKQLPQKRAFDVQHYIIRSDFNRQTKTFIGDTTVILKPLNSNFRELTLDAVGMNFQSVNLGKDGSGGNLKFVSSGSKITVILNRAYSNDEEIAIRIKYTAQPKKGVYFVDADNVEGFATPSQIWTQGEPDEIRHWFPSYDFPDDKATTEQFITTKANEIAIANGELLDVKDNANNTKTFHFKMPIVHSVYLTSMIVGDYVKREDKHKDIPLSYYVYRGSEEIIPKAYSQTPEIMRVFEEITGIDYPYNKYDQTIVAKFNFGGMENITATTMADTEIFAANYDFGREIVLDLVSHELAHSWFGNLVTTKDWSNLWLNEGFATLMEAVYREKVNGRADYLRKIKEDAIQFMIEDAVAKSRHPLFRQKPPLNDSLFDTTTYQKGGAVLHTLREEVGDEVFWKAVNLYLNRHKFGNVETADLKKAIEETSKTNLDWFFNQWIYKAGFPQLTIKHSYNPAIKTLNLIVAQKQKVDPITPTAFVLPLEIEIHTADGVTAEKIKVTKRTQNFQLKVSSKPTKLVLDPNQKIPIKLNSFMPEFSK